MIDPEMSNELKVTVVATGLCSARDQAQPGGKSTTRAATAARPAQAAPASRSASKSTSASSRYKQDGSLDFDQLELPSVLRPQCEPGSQEDAASAEPTSLGRTGTDDDMEFLDIPAFLRRQAD